MRPARFIPLALLVSAFPVASFADWLPNGTPVCVAPGIQSGLLGVPLAFEFETLHGRDLFLVWSDSRDTLPAGSNLFSEEIGPSGPALPPSNGDPAVVAPGFQGYQDAAPTGRNVANDPSYSLGVIVAWSDDRNGALDVYAKRLLDRPTNTPWPADGVPVCTAPGAQSAVRVVGDIGAGATISWLDPRDGFNAIYAQHLDINGAPQWAANGVPVCNVPAYRQQHRLTSNYDGGALFVWIDDQAGPSRVFASRFRPDGTRAPGWPAGGFQVSSLPAAGLGPALPDGFGGFYVTFFSGSGLPMACRIDSIPQSHAGWPSDGVALAQTPFQGGIDDAIRFEAGDGLVAVWEKNVNPPELKVLSFDLFAQRVLGDGTRPPGWGADGNVLCNAAGDQTNARLAAGPLILAVWEDQRPGAIGKDLYAMRLREDGVADPSWPSNGVAMVTGNGNQYTPCPVWDGAAGVLVGYLDDHDFNSFETDVFAQRVNLNGTIGTTAVPLSSPGAFRLSAPVPNPSRSIVTLQVSAAGGRVGAEILDPLGRRLRSLAATESGALRWDLTDDAGRRVQPGLYYVRVRADKESATRAVVVRR